MSKEESFEMVDSTQFDIEQGPSDSPAAGLLGSRFEEITTSRSRFSLQGRKKKLAILLGVFITVWLAGTMVFISGNADGVIDYYKSRVGMTGSGSPETDGEESQTEADIPSVEDPPKPEDYEDSDEPMLNEGGQEEKVPEDEVPTVEDPPKADIKLPSTEKKKNPITMADLGKLQVYSYPITFLHTGSENNDEGVYFYVEKDGFVTKKVEDLQTSQTILPKLSFEYNDKTFKVATFAPNPDLTWAIISTDRETEFRHSSHAYYWLYSIKDNAVTPITFDDDKSIVKISYALWSPKFNYVTFLKDNDLYIKSLDATTTRITSDGSETILNGKPDWAYEEEVLATGDALWWSPDESKVAFMKTNEKDVPQYNIDYYVQTPNGGATKYPISRKISYPKPGFKNPEVSMEVYDIDSKTTTTVDRKDSKLGEEYIIYDAFWLESDYLMIKETDRESNNLNVRMFNAQTQESKIVHEVDAVKEYNGWIEKMNSPIVVQSEESSIAYVDTYVVDGYNHLVYFSSPDAEPKPLTSGNWEVSKVPLGYDAANGIIYFHASKKPINQHLYSVSISTGEISALTDDSKDGFHTAKFSPSCKYAYLTSQNANELATSSIITIPDMTIKAPMTINTVYLASKNQFAYPTRKFHTVDVDKYEDGSAVTLDVLEYLPPNFDENKKYPLLVHYYAGPGAHVVKADIDYAFEDVVSSSLEAVVLYIEPRGNGGAGWKHRAWANKNIGYWEPRDIVSVTKQWIDKGFIDTEKTACWGWSYGGFTTLKTLEFDKGETFKYGMAVAPVTDWLLYDSIYTERYMDKPENNKEGYEVSQITDVVALSKATRFLVMHGTADDNVHVQNTYNLLDRLNIKRVENYDVQLFPDSEHSILYHNANPVVYDKLFSWLKDAFDGDYAKIGHK